MSEPPILLRLRQRRTELGLSQNELAGRVGVSRQALIAIEAGRQVPSTTLSLLLARALSSRVEDLFALPSGPQLEASLAVAELPRTPRVALGRVEGRWVAHPLSGEDRPADGLLVGERRPGAPVAIEPISDLSALEQNVLVAGCAPLLGILAERLGRHHRDARATWIPADSARALRLLEGRQVHVAGIHLADAEDPAAHIRVAQGVLAGQQATLINLARWRQGFVLAPGNPLGITLGGLRQELRWALRDPGAGAQRLLERVLSEAGAWPAQGRVAADHAEVTRMVRWGLVDIGVAIEAAALSEGLDFIPLSEERFDLLVPNSYLDAPPVARFLDLIDRPSFRSDAQGLPGYDLGLAGHALSIPTPPRRA